MDRIWLVVGFLVFWAALIALILWGWRGRQKRQADRIGELPTVPTELGSPSIGPTTGLYVGSTIAPSWQDRIAVGDIGHRSTGTLARYAAGVLLDRNAESPIWIPAESIRAVRTERGLAGKVMTRDGLLVIRWELPTGTEIDTGFRSDDKDIYPVWVAEYPADPDLPTNDKKEKA